MPFTNIDGTDKVNFDIEPFDPTILKDGKFYPEDISSVLNQPEAHYVKIKQAEVNGVPTYVMVGVGVDDKGEEVELIGIGAIAAIYCPPFNKKGGVFELNPIPDPAFV